MKKSIIIALALILGIASFSFAQTSTPRINKRQRHQQHRIANGVSSGQLTARETENLERQEAKIQADKQAAKADGQVTNQERRRIKREENRTNRHIYNAKHNNRHRG